MIGGFLGHLVYYVAGSRTFPIPLIGDVKLQERYPDLGNDIGTNTGSGVGSLPDLSKNPLARIPLVSGLINKILDN